MIAAWLDKPVSLVVLEGASLDFGDEDDLVIRNRASLMDIWVGALGGQAKAYTRADAMKLAEAMKLVKGWSFYRNTREGDGKGKRLYWREGTLRYYDFDI